VCTSSADATAGSTPTRSVTTIDFGKLTYETEFDEICKQSGMKLVEKSLIKGSIDNVFQGAFVIVLAPSR